MSSSRASITSASVAVAISRPEEAFGRLCRMIEQHGLRPEPVGPGAVRYRFEQSEAGIALAGGSLSIRLATAEPATLFFLKETAEAYLVEIDPSCAAAIAWAHDGAPPPDPGLRELVLRGAVDVYPGLRRFTFSAADLAPFASGGLHVRLLVPPSRTRAPRWPEPVRGGGLLWPAQPDRPSVRAYTLRHVRPMAGEIDVDVLIHGPEAMAGWAAAARPGERLAMLGPGGGDVPPDGRWLLLGGDETALPALARIIEARPGSAGRCIVCARREAADYLPKPAGLAMTALPPGQSERLADALRAAELPAGAAPFVWFAGERAQARILRQHFRRLPGLGPGDMSISSYWQCEDAAKHARDGAERRVTDAP